MADMTALGCPDLLLNRLNDIVLLDIVLLIVRFYVQKIIKTVISITTLEIS